MTGEMLVDDPRPQSPDDVDDLATTSAAIGLSDRTAAMDPRARVPRQSLVSRVAATILTSGLSGAIAGVIVFAGLWMTTELPLGPSDRVIELFTSAPPLSVEALRGGAFVAALLGFFVGAVSGAIYELLQK